MADRGSESAENATGYNRLDWVPVVNVSGETIPPFSVVKPTGDIDATTGFMEVDKPDEDGSLTCFVTGQTPILDTELGQACFLIRSTVAYDEADGTPVAEEMWGVGAGSWSLKKDQPGWFMLAGATDGLANAIRDPNAGGGSSSTLLVFPARITVAGSSTCTIQPLVNTSGTWGDSGSTISNVKQLQFAGANAWTPNVGDRCLAWTPDGTTYYMLPFGEADETNPGWVSTGTQSFAGNKTFVAPTDFRIASTGFSAVTTNSADWLTRGVISMNPETSQIYLLAQNQSVGVHTASLTLYATGATGSGDPFWQLRCTNSSTGRGFLVAGRIDIDTGDLRINGQQGLTTTQVFKDGAGANKTMTITEGIITSIV